MAGSMYLAWLEEQERQERLWHEECRQQAAEMARDEWLACQIESDASWDPYQDALDRAAKEHLRCRIIDLQVKWNAFPLKHHAYRPIRHDDFPSDDDIPF